MCKCKWIKCITKAGMQPLGCYLLNRWQEELLGQSRNIQQNIPCCGKIDTDDPVYTFNSKHFVFPGGASIWTLHRILSDISTSLMQQIFSSGTTSLHTSFVMDLQTFAKCPLFPHELQVSEAAGRFFAFARWYCEPHLKQEFFLFIFLYSIRLWWGLIRLFSRLEFLLMSWLRLVNFMDWSCHSYFNEDRTLTFGTKCNSSAVIASAIIVPV